MSGRSNPIAEALDNPQPAPIMAEAGDAPESAKRERPPFPPGSPVQPLGMLADISGSQKCFYLDYNRQLVPLEAGNKHGKNSLIALYGPRSDWLEANFPQWSPPVYEGRGDKRRLVKASEIIGFDQAEASRALIEECVRKGPFDPAGRMRGRGAHRTAEHNGLILHCGDKVLYSEMNAEGVIKRMRWTDPGLIERNVYSAAEAIPRPHHQSVDCEVAEQVLAILQTWNWRRPLLDARFVLGAIGAGFIGGALSWRPNVWITGGRGTGKSTLNGQDGFLHGLYGDGLFRTGDASAAGIRQSLRNSTVPVLFDEIEASDDNRRVTEVIKLARVASSGDKITRGGSDHTAHEFTLRSPFWFSSIIVPPLEPQDLSRLALLELRPLRRDVVDKGIALETLPLALWGRKLFRRMVDGWPRLAATKVKFHKALAATGHDARACDQFGTLLACGDLLINDWDTEDGLPSDEEIAFWAQACHPHKLAEVAQAVSEQEACLQHLATAMVQARGGEERESLGTWIGQAAARNVAKYGTDAEHNADKAQKRLEQMGLCVVNARWNADKGRWGATRFEPHLPGFLAVADKHQALAAIYAGGKWQSGGWKQSLQRDENAIAGITVKMARLAQRVVLVPLCAVLDESELEDCSRREALAAWMAEQTKGAEV